MKTLSLDAESLEKVVQVSFSEDNVTVFGTQRKKEAYHSSHTSNSKKFVEEENMTSLLLRYSSKEQRS